MYCYLYLSKWNTHARTRTHTYTFKELVKHFRKNGLNEEQIEIKQTRRIIIIIINIK